MKTVSGRKVVILMLMLAVAISLGFVLLVTLNYDLIVKGLRR